MRSYYRTGKRLKILTDNAYRRPWVYEMIDSHFFSSYDLPEDTESGSIISGLPYYVELGALNNLSPDTDQDDYIAQFVDGYHDSKHCRTEFRSGDRISYQGDQWEYVDSVPLATEIELQADDGKSVIVYRGESFLRIFERVLSNQIGTTNE